MLRAARSGVVLPPAETPKKHEEAAGELTTWWGLPTDLQNLGAALTAGTFYRQIGDPGEWQALVVVDQSDVALLSLGQTVEIRFDEMPNVVVPGRVDEISRRELSESPRHLSNRVGGELATETDAAGVHRPASATYQVRVILRHDNELLRIGLRGTARIHVASEPLAPRATRWLARTFHFHF
jgi:putative peptide zinc metalloprotease protein